MKIIIDNYEVNEALNDYLKNKYNLDVELNFERDGCNVSEPITINYRHSSEYWFRKRLEDDNLEIVDNEDIYVKCKTKKGGLKYIRHSTFLDDVDLSFCLEEKKTI